MPCSLVRLPACQKLAPGRKLTAAGLSIVRLMSLAVRT